MTGTPFRRAFVRDGHVCVETGPGAAFALPQPPGRAYDPHGMMARVVAVGSVDLARWRPIQDPGTGNVPQKQKERRRGTEK